MIDAVAATALLCTQKVLLKTLRQQARSHLRLRLLGGASSISSSSSHSSSGSSCKSSSGSGEPTGSISSSSAHVDLCLSCFFLSFSAFFFSAIAPEMGFKS